MLPEQVFVQRMSSWWKRAIDPFRRSLRYKLLLLALLPILVGAPVTMGVAAYWIKAFVYHQLYNKVNSDLAVAHDIFVRTGHDYLDRLGSLAESYSFRTSLRRQDKQALRRQLLALKVKAGLAFLHLMGPDGRWLDAGGGRKGVPSPLFSPALNGRSGVGVEVFSQQELAHESKALAESVRLPLLPTPHAAPSSRKVEEQGMIVRLMYPVKNLDGKVVAVLDGGVLLNSDFRFVDAIRNLVYGPGSLLQGSIGTVTLFLGDVRISTNVPLRPGERALGTRVSQVVREQVLGRGERWIDRAFVVNDWYISAYEPIVSDAGNRVGMLYAGFLERPYDEALRNAFGLFLGLFALLFVPGVWFAVHTARGIFKPIEAIGAVVRSTRQGVERRIGDVGSEDEIGLLAHEFDAMLDRLQQHARLIELSHDSLERKVTERTQALQRKNADLERTIALLRQTRRQLVEAEKLAALGELTAGVAHEINNPVAVILGNIEVLRDELGDGAAPVREEIDLIIRQVYRIKAIVENLLHYARPAAGFDGEMHRIDVNAVIDDTLSLMRHTFKKAGVEVTFEPGELEPVGLHRQVLQQVMLNLLGNAVNALPQGGNIHVATKPWGTRGIVVVVRDSGSGIAPEHMARLFEPFFTTRPEGTGLGLPISYGLVRRYGGRITARSTPGKGSEFRVWLLYEPAFIEDEETHLLRLHASDSDEP
ncbi:MAG: cache domain-containing protein [Acidihalobacter sp.]